MGTLLGDALFGGQSRYDRQQITDLYHTLGPLAKSATEAGQEHEGRAGRYYDALMGGNQQAQQEAIAPIENRAAAQQQAQRQALASSGTARGGGVNAAQQQGADLATKTGVDALTALMPQAAHGEQTLGATQTGEGLQGASTLGSLAEQERRTNLAHQTAEGGELGKAIGAVADMVTHGASKPITAATDIGPQAEGGVQGTAPGTNPSDWLSALQQQFPSLAPQ